MVLEYVIKVLRQIKMKVSNWSEILDQHEKVGPFMNQCTSYEPMHRAGAIS